MDNGSAPARNELNSQHILPTDASTDPYANAITTLKASNMNNPSNIFDP